MQSTFYLPVDTRHLLEELKNLPSDTLREIRSEIDAILLEEDKENDSEEE